MYDTGNREVKKCLNDVVKVFEDQDLLYPVMIHCNSGKDRTAVAADTLFKIPGIPEGIIVEE